MGILLFWIHYIVAVVLLYHDLFCIYVKTECNNACTYKTYKITENDERLKQPLWIIILFFIVLFIPGLNLFVYIAYLCAKLINDFGSSKYNKYYCKSIFTKKY